MSSRQPGPCLWCESSDVQKIQWGQPAGGLAKGFAAASDLPAGPRRQWVCRNCGRMWSHLPLRVRRGEVVETEHGPIKATAADVAWLRQIRAFLLEVFAQQRQVDAAELKEHVGLPCELGEVARLLELLTEDCTRRGEPSLSALVGGVPESPDERGGPSTEKISQDDINDLLDGVYDETDDRDKPDPAPEPV
jgi:hypothetical protein